MNWIVLVQRRKRSSWEGIETCVSGREESSTGLKVFASVLKWPRGYTSGAVCPRARLIAESEAKSGGVKISNQPMCLSEKFACGETFHNAPINIELCAFERNFTKPDQRVSYHQSGTIAIAFGIVEIGDAG